MARRKIQCSLSILPEERELRKGEVIGGPCVLEGGTSDKKSRQ